MRHGGGIPITLVLLPWVKDAYGATEPVETVEPFWPVIDYISNAGMLIMWGGFFLAFHFHNLSRRSELDRVRLEVAARDLQLSTLRSQLNPHFLFNSFSLLRTLVQRDPEAARDSITHLAEMMRHSLSLARHNTISVASEVDFVESYLALERQRFEDRLRLSQSVPDELRHQKIPSMLLYTLVENAVKYGISQSIEGVDVSYSIWAEARHLCLRVANGGRLLKASDSTGTGLENIRRRLELLYAGEAKLAISELDGLVVAEARWPALNQEATP